jgi:hypothetical protein
MSKTFLRFDQLRPARSPVGGISFCMESFIPDTGTFGRLVCFDSHPYGTGAMSKELIARHDLERIAMQEIRAFPGCELVSDVEIEYQLDKERNTNWTIHVFTSAGANMERIQYAISTTRKRLRHRYDLRTES